MSRIKALIFDVGGTVLDWHTGVKTALSDWGTEKTIKADWGMVTDHWRNAALTRMLKNNADLPLGTNMNDVHRMTLDGTLEHFGIQDLGDVDRDQLSKSWYKIPAWPDAR